MIPIAIVKKRIASVYLQSIGDNLLLNIDRRRLETRSGKSSKTARLGPTITITEPNLCAVLGLKRQLSIDAFFRVDTLKFIE